MTELINKMGQPSVGILSCSTACDDISRAAAALSWVFLFPYTQSQGAETCVGLNTPAYFTFKS